ncbi:MAG: MmcQ/YjbR family DNA-binding protein [Acidobacteriota bacterium]
MLLAVVPPAEEACGAHDAKPFARQLRRVRKICLSLPHVTEKLSHGGPTFFVEQRVFAMFSNNHHNDGHVAVLDAYYRPPYVGGSGWIGVELDQVSHEALDGHIKEALTLIVDREPLPDRAPHCTEPGWCSIVNSHRAPGCIKLRR